MTPSSSPGADSFIAAGTIGVIYAIDENHVIKRRPLSGNFECHAYDIEVRAYERLGHHARIAQCEKTGEGLLLERGDCLRRKLQSVNASPIPLSTKLRWAQEGAEGLAYIHSKHIVHADVGCHNMIVDNASHVKFIDFAGSGIDGEAPLVCYEWCSFQPDTEIGVRTDIFAFGSMLFEIETGRVPYYELEGNMEMGKLVTTVEGLFSQKKFPVVKKLVLGSIISGCWNGNFMTMDEVYQDITTCCSEECSE